MLRRDSPTPREHMSERLWMRNRMTLLYSVCHHHEFVKTSHRGSHETCSPQVLTEPSITVAGSLLTEKYSSFCTCSVRVLCELGSRKDTTRRSKEDRAAITTSKMGGATVMLGPVVN